MRKRIQGKNVLVTGGAGFIGSHLVDQLVREKAKKVVVVDNFFLGKRENLRHAQSMSRNVLVLNHDAAALTFMARTIRTHKIQVIFNLATKALPYSFDDPDDAYLINVMIANTLLRLQLQKHFQTLIHFSSSEAYGTATANVMSETHPLEPRTPYAAGKASADVQILAWNKFFNLDVSIVRPFNNYGPRQNEGLYAGVIPITIRRILSGKPPIIEGDGTQTRDFMYVADTVRAAVDVYENPRTRGRVINIATGKETSIRSLILSLRRSLGFRGAMLYRPKRPGDVQRHRADITLAEKLIGFKPRTPLAQGLRETINWFKQ